MSTLIFFFKEIDKIVWFKVFVNYFLIFGLILSELLFLSNFFILINGQDNIIENNKLIVQLNNFINNSFENFTSSEGLLILLIFFLILKNILNLYQNYFQFNFIYNLAVIKASKLLKVYLFKSYQDFTKKDLSVYIKQITRDIEHVFVGIFGLLISTFGDLIYLISLLIFSFSIVNINIDLTIIFLLFIFGFFINFLFSISKKLGETRGRTEQNTFKFLSDILRIFKELKVKDKSETFINRFSLTYNTYYNTRIRQGIVNLTPKSLLELMILIFFFLIFVKSNMTIESFIIKYSVFALAILRLLPVVARLTGNFSQIIYNLKSIEYIKNDIENFKDKTTKDRNKINIINSLSIKNIKHSYFNKKEKEFTFIFNNFNYQFIKGNIYGIYGPSGSGKTTLLNILSGLTKPKKGTVYINKKKIDFHDLYKKVNLGLASQENIILDENIIVNSTLDFKINLKNKRKLKELILYFNLKKFTNNKFFDNKNLASIKNMSGGEMQRINFIRAIIDDPQLLILDEPTSSLDLKNEKKLLTYLNKIKKNKIIILSSHKLSQKKYFDKIIDLEL